MKKQHETCVYLHIHIAGLYFCFLFARLCPISLFPIILILTIRLLSLYYENIKTNASDKRLTITTNALPLIRMACELLPNMLRICVFTNFMNLILNSQKLVNGRECIRIQTNAKRSPCDHCDLLPNYRDTM